MLGYIPVGVNLTQKATLNHLIRMIGLVSKLRARLLRFKRLLADDVGNEVINELCLRLALLAESLGNRHMWLTLDI